MEYEQDPIKAAKLYKNLLADGYNEDNLGSEKDFLSALSDKTKASTIYQRLIDDGYNEDNLGKKDEFLNAFSKKKSGSFYRWCKGIYIAIISYPRD